MPWLIVETPEGVALRTEIAGPGRRFAAGLADGVLLAALMALVALVGMAMQVVDPTGVSELASGILLFGIPASKDAEGTGAYDDEGVIQLATRAIKDAYPDLVVITDVCLCEYTDHGHCGLITANGEVDNDSSVELLARTAVSQAKAGADIVAPSDMMDGRIGEIRRALDAESLSDVPIVAYSAKFASAFYGLSFPTPENGIVTVSYPIVLTPS